MLVSLNAVCNENLQHVIDRQNTLVNNYNCVVNYWLLIDVR